MLHALFFDWRANLRNGIFLGAITTLYIMFVNNFDGSVLFWSPVLLILYSGACFAFMATGKPLLHLTLQVVANIWNNLKP